MRNILICVIGPQVRFSNNNRVCAGRAERAVRGRGGLRGAAVRGARGVAAARGGRRALPAHARQLPARRRRQPHQGAFAGNLAGSCNMAKRVVDFRHSSCNATRRNSVLILV